MEFTSLFRRFAISPLPVPASWSALPLRLILGFGFVEHGYAKLSRGADGFIAILHAMGMPFADLLGWATIVVEIVGGLLILTTWWCRGCGKIRLVGEVWWMCRVVWRI
jgi:putative oxidoreductase